MGALDPTGTRESYAPAAEALSGFASSASADRLFELGGELLTVVGLLRREPRLRRALADTGRSGEDRAGLLRVVLGDKVSGDAVDLLGTLVTARWPSSVALLNSAERLGVETLLASAERADELNDVEDELFRFGQVVDGNRELAAALSDSAAGLDRRTELVGDLLAGKVKPTTQRLTEVALAGFGGRGFSTSIRRLVELAAERRDRSIAYVTTATALTEEQEQRLGARLAELYGRQVALKIEVDESILGGARVQVGSDLYDGTIARRLAEARTALTK